MMPSNRPKREQREMNLSYAPNLLTQAETILGAFANGNHPTFDQLDRFTAAIEACKAERLCGHLVDEDCECGAEEGP